MPPTGKNSTKTSLAPMTTAKGTATSDPAVFRAVREWEMQA
jgi:hypothetical protein